MIIFAFVVVVGFYFLFFRGTFLGFSFVKGNYFGFAFFNSFFFTMAAGVLLLNFVGLEGRVDFAYTHPETVRPISYLIYYALFAYLLATFIFLRVLRSRFYKVYNNAKNNDRDRHIALSVSILSLLLIGMAMIIFGAKHAFFESMIRGVGDLRYFRLGNVHDTGMPTVINSFLQFCYISIACLIGAGKIKFRFKLFLFALAIVLTTFHGSKAPLATMVMIVFISYFCFNKIQFGLKSILYFILYASLFFLTLVFVVRAQYGDLTLFEVFEYLFSRLGFGQLGGVYEQFNIKLRDSAYLLHAVPFANWFFDYPSFNRDIMIFSENIKDPTSTGSKNSLFIAEAYAMGGWGLVLISPVIVAFTQIVGFYFLFKCFAVKLCMSPKASLLISGFLTYGMLTISGGFAAFLFMKGLVMLLIMVSVLWLISYALPIIKFRR